MSISLHVLADYHHWLAVLERGERDLCDAHNSREAHAIAMNILIAHGHLSQDDESPYQRESVRYLGLVSLAMGLNPS